MNKFTTDILKFCKEHPDYPDSIYYLKCIEESEKAKSEERKHWKCIATSMENYDLRVEG